MSLDFGKVLWLQVFRALQSLGQLMLLPSLTALLLGVWVSLFGVLEIRHLFGHLQVASCGFFGRWYDPILCIHILVWFLCRLCAVVIRDIVIDLDIVLTCCKLFCIFFLLKFKFSSIITPSIYSFFFDFSEWFFINSYWYIWWWW